MRSCLIQSNCSESHGHTSKFDVEKHIEMARASSVSVTEEIADSVDRRFSAFFQPFQSYRYFVINVLANISNAQKDSACFLNIGAKIIA